MARTTIRSEDITAGQIKSADLETNVVIDGDLTVDTNTLYVDSASNEVGIGTTSPATKLQVVGQLSVEGGGASIQRRGGNAWLMVSSNQGYGTSGMHLKLDNDASGGRAMFIDNTTERMRIDNNGNFLVGKTTAGTTTNGVFLSAANGTNFVFPSSHYVIFNRNAGGAATLLDFRSLNASKGSISFNGTGISYNTSSDYRLKENVQPLTGGIDRLKQLKPSHWTWTQSGEYGEGFVAHEAATVVPEAVSGEKDAMTTEEYEVTPAVFNDEGVETTAAVMGTREVPEYQGIDQSKLVPLLTSALQEAVAKIESLEARVATLEAN